MRRLRTLSLALTGLALTMPTATRAGSPEICSTCAGQRPAPHVHHDKTRRPAHLCAACAARAAQGGSVQMMAAASGVPCATCAGSNGSAPGFAVIGDPSAVPMMASAGGDAPGYAVVGGAVASAEPAPIGVMRTNYATPEMPGVPGAGLPPVRGQAPYAPGATPYAKANEIPPGLYTPQNTRRRSHVLARMIGIPDFGRRGAEAESRAREAHAMTSYGAASAPNELPASMVYGGGR